MESLILFSTNDPARPEVRVTIIVPQVLGSGIQFWPKAVAFGTVHVGGKVLDRIDVIDTSSTPRRVLSASTPDSNRINVSVISTETTRLPESAPVRGWIIAKIEVQANTESPGSLYGRVALTVEGSPITFEVPVSGRVVPQVELYPTTVVFPVQSAEGPLYKARLTASSSLGAFDLSAVECPRGIKVEIAPAHSSVKQELLVTGEPSQIEMGQGKVGVIGLQARQGDRTYPIELKVYLNVP